MRAVEKSDAIRRVVVFIIGETLRVGEQTLA